MSQTNRLANKRFKIMEDYNRRQQELEDHAVKMILNETNPNVPMVPDLESAHYRRICRECTTPFWAAGPIGLCEPCGIRVHDEEELELELRKLRREVELRKAKEQLKLLRKMQRDNRTPAEIIAAIGEPSGFDI